VIYAEDLVAPRRFELGRHTVTREEIVAFAAEWDPLPMHVDEAAAQAGPFGGLIASGLHTLGVYQRLAVPVVWREMAIIAGRTLREIRMMRPVRPDTTLTGHVEWREVQPRAAGDAVLISYAELCEAPDGPAVFSVLVELVVAGRGSAQLAG
jgi:acyl dehydratase